MKKTNNNMNDELDKLSEKEMDDVSGGIFWLGKDYDDGFEKSCTLAWHHENECKKSADGYHYWVEGKGCARQCKHCNTPGMW
ncbi:MAG: hypothetical protein E7241_08565 [Lachnospiraceae bacterium]|nr:hypothetical protein [Lachnospiraceae bacterium]